MIDLYLDETTRERILNHDIENSENCYDRNMYYITNSENQILYDIIYGMDIKMMEKMGFEEKDICRIMEDDMNIKFTNKKKYYIKEVN